MFSSESNIPYFARIETKENLTGYAFSQYNVPEEGVLVLLFENELRLELDSPHFFKKVNIDYHMVFCDLCLETTINLYSHRVHFLY